MSIIFKWKREELNSLLATCERDDVLPLALKHIPPGGRVLEAGCGPGRFVKYFHDRAWRVIGLEIFAETVSMVHEVWPELEIVPGDLSRAPFPQATFDGVFSLGVVEHWSQGPEKPLREILRILKRGGIAIITVPCLNQVRRLKNAIYWNEAVGLLRLVGAAGLRRKPFPLLRPNRLRKDYKYVVSPAVGPFFEYHMAPQQFRRELEEVGFEIIEHVPTGHLDGVYHELNPFRLLVQFEDWRFRAPSLVRRASRSMAEFPFFHCHMQAAVVRKP